MPGPSAVGVWGLESQGEGALSGRGGQLGGCSDGPGIRGPIALGQARKVTSCGEQSGGSEAVPRLLPAQASDWDRGMGLTPRSYSVDSGGADGCCPLLSPLQGAALLGLMQSVWSPGLLLPSSQFAGQPASLPGRSPRPAPGLLGAALDPDPIRSLGVGRKQPSASLASYLIVAIIPSREGRGSPGRRLLCDTTAPLAQGCVPAL